MSEPEVTAEHRAAAQAIMEHLGLVPQIADCDGRDKALSPQDIAKLAEILARHFPRPAAPPYENRYTMVCAMTEDFKHVLLLRKSSELYLGQWNAPGGKVEPSETELECAVREMQEETQLAIPADSLCYVMSFSCECDQKEGLHEVIVYGAILPRSILESAKGTAWEPVMVWSEERWAGGHETVWYVPSLLRMVIGRMKQRFELGIATQIEQWVEEFYLLDQHLLRHEVSHPVAYSIARNLYGSVEREAPVNRPPNEDERVFLCADHGRRNGAICVNQPPEGKPEVETGDAPRKAGDAHADNTINADVTRGQSEREENETGAASEGKDGK